MPEKIDFPAHLLNQTPATIRWAFDKTEPILLEERGEIGHTNISGILTRIIQDTGRFAERWASDCIYTIDSLRELCCKEYPLEQEIDEILVFAIRQDGVDGNQFLMNQLHNSIRPPYPYVYATPYYRRILGVRVHIFMQSYPGCSGRYPRVECQLKDISNGFHTLNQADLDDNGRPKGLPYPEGNPCPIDPYAEVKAAREKAARKESEASNVPYD